MSRVGSGQTRPFDLTHEQPWSRYLVYLLYLSLSIHSYHRYTKHCTGNTGFLVLPLTGQRLIEPY